MDHLYLCNWEEEDIPDPPPPPLVGASPTANDMPLNSEAPEESPSRQDITSPIGVSSPQQPLHEYRQLGFQRSIEVNPQWGIGMLGLPDQHYDSATSPERLMHDILHSHSSLMASRKHKSNADNNEEKSCQCGVNFECNVCFEIARDPVVTPCGHLFCWSCLHQWLHSDSEYSGCPVCKAEVLEVNVTPIYGGGVSETVVEGNHGGGSGDSVIKIPPRPHARRVESSGPQLRRPGNSGPPASLDTVHPPLLTRRRRTSQTFGANSTHPSPSTAGQSLLGDGASTSSTIGVIEGGDVAPYTSARTRGRYRSFTILDGRGIRGRRRRPN